MQKLLLVIFSIVVISFSWWSCKKDSKVYVNPCPYMEEAPPRYLVAPDSVRTDSTIDIGIIYNNRKYCQRFDSIYHSLTDSVMTISIQTKIDTCNCNDQFDLLSPHFYYQAPHTPGHSIIRIHVSSIIFYSDTIVVY